MRKILLAVNAIKPDASLFDFACEIGKLTNSGITGIFLDKQKLTLTAAIGSNYFDWSLVETSAEHRERLQKMENTIRIFQDTCAREHVSCSVHCDHGVPTDGLIHDSSFADLLILDPAMGFDDDAGIPSRFAKEILQDAQCPVIIASDSFKTVEEIVFTYNGSRSSIFAMRQFAYLFPGLSDKKAVVLQVNEEGVWDTEEKLSIRDWLQNYYSAIGFEVLKGDVEDRLFDYLMRRDNVFVVMGAYGRSLLSQWFRQSHANLIMRTICHPLFITHQ